MEDLRVNNYLYFCLKPKSLIQIYLNLSIFVQTDFHSAFNDVKSPRGDVTERHCLLRNASFSNVGWIDYSRK